MANILTKFIFDKVGVPKAKTFMDLTSFRHKLIAGNVANASTPGYRTRDIDFKKEFARLTGESKTLSGATTQAGHIPIGSNDQRPPKPSEDKVKVGEMNSVDIDREVAEMAKNELLFTVEARLLQRKFDGLRNAITSK